jgi:hypothetical protein
VQIYDIDVRGARRDPLFQDPRPLVDQGIDQTADDLLIRDRPPGQPQRPGVVENQLLHFLRRRGVAIPGGVVIPAATALLPKASPLADQVRGHGVDHLGLLRVVALADRPGNIITRQVTHAKRAEILKTWRNGDGIERDLVFTGK